VKILVAAASKHGATKEIAERIGSRLGDAGFAVEVAATDEAPGPGNYDAAVVGSGVYAGNWLKSARQYVEQHAATLATMPVWLFSSGPLGNPPKPDADEAVKADAFVEQTQAVGHELIAGAAAKDKLGFAEKSIMKAVRAPYGDFRDWDAIDAWADTIARQLTS